MTDDEARKLGVRFVDTWPTGPRAYVWRDLLAALEPGLAWEAYRRLEVDCTKAPNPGQFHAAYRAARAAAKSVGDDPPVVCRSCDGNGWVYTESLVVQLYGKPHPYTQMVRCACNPERSNA